MTDDNLVDILAEVGSQSGHIDILPNRAYRFDNDVITGDNVRAFIPRFEQLERRVLLSGTIYDVSSAQSVADINAVIVAADSGDTINFSEGTSSTIPKPSAVI